MSLSKKISELEEELLKLNSKRSKHSEKRRSSKRAYLNLLGIRYHETIIILKRINITLKKKKSIQDKLKDLSNGEINDPKILQIINEDFRLNDEFSVDLQSLYDWVYKIKEIFSDCEININLMELKRISHLRNHFITHITRILSDINICTHQA